MNNTYQQHMVATLSRVPGEPGASQMQNLANNHADLG